MLDKLRLPVFTINDIKKVKAYKNNKSYSVLVHRLKEKHKIKEIEKGKYTLSDDPYLVATNIVFPSYVSFWSCSYYKGFTEQIINTIQIACSVKKKGIEFMNQKIEFIKINPKQMFGFKRDRNGVFIATDEKLLIDCLMFQRHIGNFDEIMKVLQGAEMDKQIIIEFLKIIKNNSLIKRIGYLLEKYKAIDICADFKKEIKKDKNYIKLDIYSKSKSINKKWRLKT